ncbi:hypothetical protein [Terasakiella sp. SH-1]|nr:hypothetical protein [Terasakiella sp. SH-1]
MGFGSLKNPKAWAAFGIMFVVCSAIKRFIFDGNYGTATDVVNGYL